MCFPLNCVPEDACVGVPAPPAPPCDPAHHTHFVEDLLLARGELVTLGEEGVAHALRKSNSANFDEIVPHIWSPG